MRPRPVTNGMKKFFLTSSALVFILAAGWHYLPQTSRGKVISFIGAAASRDTGEIKNFIGDVLLPPDPEKRRTVLVEELKKNFSEFKRRSSRDGSIKNGPSSSSQLGKATTQQILGASEKILAELEAANDDKSLPREAAERILDIILPGGSRVCGGKNEKDPVP